MGARIRMQIDPADKILLKRSLNKNGEGQRFLPMKYADYPIHTFRNDPVS